MMLSAAKHLLSLILVLALATGGAMRAMAHDGQAGLIEMVICGVDGETTVLVDPSGAPVAPCVNDPCALCVLAGPAHLPQPDAIPAPERRVLVLGQGLPRVAVAFNPIIAANARAPPATKVFA